MIRAETEMYKYLEGFSIAPKFVGHVNGNDSRVIGFLIEYIAGARAADSPDVVSKPIIKQCNSLLSQLHQLGIKYNNAHLSNCILRTNGTPVLINFEHAVVLNREYPKLALDFYLDFEIMSTTSRPKDQQTSSKFGSAKQVASKMRSSAGRGC
ncbi:hypothetical protein F5B18DRAFT_654499 [Nemania serpens]|nr:hypothetical protein F5B18DRAFT_654499 [Nemania serpens]